MKNLHVFNEEKFAAVDGRDLIDFFSMYQLGNFNTVILDGHYTEPDFEHPLMETFVIEFRATKGLSTNTKKYEFINHRAGDHSCKNMRIEEVPDYDEMECENSNPHDEIVYDVLDSAPCESTAGKKRETKGRNFKRMPY